MAIEIDDEFFEYTFLFQCIKSDYFFGTVIDHVDISYFKDNKVKSLLSSIVEFYSEYKKKPNLTELRLILADDTKKKHFKAVLDVFKDLDQDIDDDLLVSQTETFFRERGVYNTMIEVAEDFAKVQPSDVLERFQKCCNFSIITNIGHDYFIDIDKHIEYLQTEQQKISSGYDFFDTKLKGGFNVEGKALHIVMGATNAGKSIFLANMAINVLKQGYVVPIISLEMSEQIYSHRISANLSNISFDDLKTETTSFKNSIQEFQNRVPNAKLLVKEFPPGALTVNGLDAYLQKIRNKGYNFDIVFLDYITLLQGIGDNLYEKGKNLAEGIRALGYKYGVDFVTVLQANRSGVKEGEQPKLDNTSESMGIAHTADSIFSIYRKEEDIELNILRCAALKSRVGENHGVCFFETDYEHLRLLETEAPFEDDEEESKDDVKEQLNALGDFLVS